MFRIRLVKDIISLNSYIECIRVLIPFENNNKIHVFFSTWRPEKLLSNLPESPNILDPAQNCYNIVAGELKACCE